MRIVKNSCYSSQETWRKNPCHFYDLQDLISYEQFFEIEGQSKTVKFFSEIVDFIGEVSMNTIGIATEPWLNNKTLGNTVLGSMQNFVHLPRPEWTGLKRGGVVGVWTTLSFKMHVRKFLMTADRKFMGWNWVMKHAKYLINFSYCSRKNLFPYFFDEIGVEFSQAFASKMGVFIFEDYNIDLLKQDESAKLYDFSENCFLIKPNVT